MIKRHENIGGLREIKRRRKGNSFCELFVAKEGERKKKRETICLDRRWKILSAVSAYDKSHQEWIEYITVFKREIYDLSEQPAQQSSTRIRSVRHVSVSFEQTTNTERRKLVLLLWKNKPTTNRATYKSTYNSLVNRYLFQPNVTRRCPWQNVFYIERKYR